MGFLDNLFGGDKPTQKNIDKLVVRVKERYAQPEYRREAMDKLIAMATPEAITGVLARFTVVAQSPHWDEEEKRWLVDQLAGLGEPARSALLAFLKKADHIAFAAKALQRLDKPEQFVADLIACLTARPPEDHRSIQGKAELVAALADTNDARARDAVVPYLDDHSDDVRCASVDALERLWALAGDTSAAQDKLRAAITDDARSARVLRHTAGAMQRLGVAVDPTKALAPAVAEDFVVKDGKLQPAHAA
ncbi:MAG: HEAT repeat domain-containing protein [Deltaproteobacteria bacterium]|nr:HEAT repeat domain-containing protein [Deltaproteobacteria bacterium]